MKILFACLFIFLLAAKVCPQHLDILPDTIIYDKYYADAQSHQFSLSKDFGSRQWFGNIGAVVPLFDFKYEGHLLQVSAASTAFNTIIKTPGHIQVYTVDYIVDFFFDYNINPRLPVRFILGHHSAHYSDDGITELFNYPISYVRDYTGLHVQYKFGSAKLYAGYYYNFHIEPETDKKNTFQLGADKFISISPSIELYVAVDFKFKQEVRFIPTQSLQAGIKIASGERKAIRAAYTFRSGFDERGQLYNKKDCRHSAGVYLDF